VISYNLIIRGKMRRTAMSDVTVTQVARHFAEYLNRVAYRRESFTLVRGNKLLAELRPLPQGARLSELPGLLASLPHLSPSEAAEFADDLTAAREELARAEVSDAWQS
jgi:antitoxin (DNA-binding transcriptional repressor) of toxin-antitoxin stability system